MRRTTASLAALAAAVGLTACGSSGSTVSHTVYATSTPTATQSVKSIVWGLPAGEPTSVDPMFAGADSEMTVSSNLCDNLLRLNPDFSVGPGLATSAEWKDPKSFVIDLRPDAKFWDGKPVTAADVVFSLQRSANPDLGGYYTGTFTNVAAIKQTGAHQVTLSMKAPDAQLRNAIAGPSGVVVEQAFAAKAGQSFGAPGGKLMCSGPYELVAWNTGDSIVTRANPAYWGGRPKVGQITYKFLGDASTLTTALRSGDIDGAYSLPISTAVGLARNASGTVYRGPATSSLSFGPATDKGPAADPRVREALDLSIDKKALITSMLRGFGTPQRTFVAPLAWSGDPAAATYRKAYDALPADDTQDLARAKALIKAAGVGSRKLVMALPAGATTETQAATAVQAAAKAIGVTIVLRTLQPTEFSAMFYEPAKRVGIDFIVTVGYQEVPGSLYYAPEFATKEGLYNWSGYNNPQVAALLEKARNATDPAVTAQNYVQAQKIFAPDRLQITLAGLDSLLYLRKGLTGAPASMVYYSSPWALTLGGSN